MTESASSSHASHDPRLDSWKEIAAYLGVSVRTAQRWENLEGLPVKRHQHSRLATTYAYPDELEAWRRSRAAPSSQTAPVTTRARSIAILPFASLDRDEETEIIGDGLSEELIAALGRVERLKVVARSSSFIFKNVPVDIRDVGAQLGVDCVVDGSVRRDGKRLRVIVQLIDAHDGCQLWASRFDRRIDDLFDRQDELAGAIAERLELELTNDRNPPHRSERNPDVYGLFLRARYFWNQRTRSSLERALDLYQQAEDLDPTFAPAYAGIADCYTFLWVYGGYSCRARSRDGDRQAIEIDPTSSDAYTSLGLTRVLRYDFVSARRAFRQALDANPSNARARHWDAMAMANLGRFSDGIEAIRRALELDPLGTTANQDLGRLLYFARDYHEALKQLRFTLEISPSAPFARRYLGFVLMQLGELEQAAAVSASEPVLRAFALARMGNRDEAQRTLAQDSTPGASRCTWTALLHLGLGEHEQAIALRNAGELHEPAYLNMCAKVEPLFEPLRSDRAFEALLPVALPNQGGS